MEEIEESELFEGFLRDDRRLASMFIALLLPVIRSECRRRWPSLRNRADEVESKALYLLAKWRHDRKANPSDDKLDPRQTIAQLAGALVNRSAITERKVLNVERKVMEAAGEMAKTTGEPPPSPEAQASAHELSRKLWGLVAGLKASHQAVLRAQEAAQNGGPPIAEALGVAPASARKLLERAREALLARAKANKLDLGRWLGEEEEVSHG